MKKIRLTNMLVSAALCAGTFQAACAADIRPLNGIAAEVNGSIVTYGDIERTAALMHANGGGRADTAALLGAARQSLIERALLADAARMQGLKAEAEEVDAEIARRAHLAGVDVKAVYADAARSGWGVKQYRLEVAKDLLLERMMAGIDGGVRVDDKQIDDFIAQARGQGQPLPPAEPYTVYRVQRIVMGINKNNTASSVGARMRLIAEAVGQGHDMGALARRYSQDQAAAAGGIQELTAFGESEKVAAFLQTLKNGQISMPVQTASDWQLIRMLGQRSETDPVKTLREAVRRHLLQQERQKARQQFVAQLQQHAVIREN